MKTKNFYSKRIKALSAAFGIFIAGLFLIGIVSAEGTAKQKFENTTKSIAIGGASVAVVSISIKGDLKKKGKYDNLDDETKAYIDSLDEQVSKALNEVQSGIMSSEDIKKEHDKWMKDYGTGLTDDQIKQFNNLIKNVSTLAAELEYIKENGISAPGTVKSLATQMKEAKADVEKFLKKERPTLKFDMALKAGGADQAATDIATHSIGLRVPGIGQLPVRKPFLKDLFPTVFTNLEYIKYIDQETITRDAKNVASAAASTHTSKITWKERSVQIVNVRDLVDVPIDMLSDYDFVEGELRNMLDVNVQLKVDAGLYNGDGIAPNLHSVDEVASEFDASNTLGGSITAWSNTVDTPNIFDLVIAMTSQIVSLGQDGAYMPNVVLFNTIDRYKALLIKNKNGDYQMPPFVVRNGNKDYTIDGMIVRSNPGVAANSLMVFDSTKGTIYQRKAAVAEISYENASNFETEVATMKVYERLNLLIRNVNKNAFMKCSDIATALTALATP